MSIEIANESGIPADEAGLVAVAAHVLGALDINPLADLSLLLVTEEHMATLHQRWMDESGPTDVLAFPMDELRPGRGLEDEDPSPALLGDVVLCPAVAARQAAPAGHSAQDELALLTVHGVLHLLGYDHAEPEEKQRMFALQERLLTEWSGQR